MAEHTLDTEQQANCLASGDIKSATWRNKDENKTLRGKSWLKPMKHLFQRDERLSFKER